MAFEIELFGDITFSGYEIYDETVMTPTKMANLLREAKGDDLVLRMHGPGGFASPGIAIHNQLVDYSRANKSKIEGVIVGDIASVMTIIGMSCHNLQAYESTQFMIHDPHNFVHISASTAQKVVDDMIQLRDIAAKIYSDRSGKKLKEVKEWMADTTWFKAKDAVKNGFVDATISNKQKLKPSTLLMEFKNCPDELKAEIEDSPLPHSAGTEEARKALLSMQIRTRMASHKEIVSALQGEGIPSIPGKKVLGGVDNPV